MKHSSKLTKRSALLAAIALCAAALSGCAATAPAQNPERVVSKRAQDRWDLLLKSDYAKAYEYLTPAERVVVSQQSYVNRFGEGAKWLSAKLDSVNCESAERCTAVVKLETLVVARGFSSPISSKISEIWIKDENNWWFHQNP